MYSKTLLLILFNCVYFVLNAQVRFPVGQNANYNFSVIDLQGKKINIESLKGKVVIIHQWATWCGPCKKEEPMLQNFYDTYKNEIELIMISDESIKRLKSYKQKHKRNLPYYTVNGGSKKLPKVYYSDTIPVSFIISKSGEIKMIANGVLDWQSDAVQKFIEKLIDE